MTAETREPRLTERFSAALAFAHQLHRTQTRKGGDVPYIGHLLSVSALVIEAGGSETQAIAGLLHDAAEDQGGTDTLTQIEAQFGAQVAAIVAQCSDTFETPKPPWQQRKQRYVDHLGSASDDTILVSLADKVDNARAILRDVTLVGPVFWQRFSVQDPELHLWYYRSLLAVYRARSSSWLVTELSDVVDRIENRVRTRDAVR